MTRALTEADLAAADAETHGVLPKLHEMTRKPLVVTADGLLTPQQIRDFQEGWGRALDESAAGRRFIAEPPPETEGAAPSEPARIGLDLGEMSRRRWWQFWGKSMMTAWG